MSRTVDNRVVEMEFDNSRFEGNVSTSMSTLEKLKQCLRLDGATKGFDEIDAASKRVSFSGLSSAVETVKYKFSALEVMGVTALANITNSAVNAGKRISSALTIDPIKTGFQEYETQINAVQTILANTQKEGTNINDVNKALDELNEYADKTIYNFTEMTRNIGTFTAAGVKLDTSVAAIQGIANLAAVSGSTSQQASTAMYQLSQALASGTVKLMDWNSVVNAGMGGQVFQDALKDTARLHGIAIDKIIKDEGSFRETLQKGWLTADILTETLKKFTTSGVNEYLAEQTKLSVENVAAMREEALASEDRNKAFKEMAKTLSSNSKLTEDQIYQLLNMSQTAEEAATKVKTFTQLWDVLKEAAQSGWSQSWRTIVGDFEESKVLFTEIADTLSALIGESANARNEVLKGWKELGGRTAIVDALRNAFEGVMSIAKPISQAFRDIFPRTTAQQLADFSTKLRDLTAKLKISDETAGKLKRTFKGIFSIFDIGKKILAAIGKSIANLFGSEGVGSLMESILNGAADIGDYFTKLNEGFTADGITDVLSTIVTGISNVLKGATEKIKGFKDVFGFIGDGIVSVAGKILSGIKAAFTFIGDNFSFTDIFAGLAGGGIFVAAKKFSGLMDKIKDVISNIFKKGEDEGSLKSKITGALNALHDSLQSFSTGIKISSLVSIAVAVGVLTASLRSIAKLDAGDIVKSLSAIGIMILMLNKTLESMSKSLASNPSKGLVKAGVSLILVATAVRILAGAMEKFAGLTVGQIAKGLIAIGLSLVMLTAALKSINGVKIPLRTSISLIALAESCKIMGDAVAKFGGMNWDEIAKGLVGMGGALVELVAAVAVLNKFGGGKSILGSLGLLIAVQSLSTLADGLEQFGEINWDVIGRGLVAMGAALAEVSGVITVVGKIAGFSSLFAAGAIFIVIKGLDDLAVSLQMFGDMDWETIARGLVGMGGALTEVTAVTGILGKLTGFSGILGAGALLIAIQGLGDLANALEVFGLMEWETIARGLVGMGGALAEVAVVTGLLGGITGLGGILGAGALLIAVQGLGDLAGAFKKFGEMSWEEIGRGLVGMGGALTEVAVITGLLGGLGGLAALLGAGTLLVAVQGLGDLADAFKKFGEMSWDEIQNGLAGMGLAMGELGLGGILNTFSIFGAAAISEMASSVGVMADGIKKWEDVTVPEGLGNQLGLLADGVQKFTWAGLGADAISTSAASIGVLADSVKKWVGVEIPDGLAEKMSALAEGIKKFTWGGMGANTLSSVAPALGALADSVKKWATVTIPEDIESGLTSIANGVKAFGFAFMGGWSINAIIEPLSALSDSIKKWSGVTVPENIEDDLTRIANGIESFSFAFIGGWSIGGIVEPLASLADAIKKWSGVTIPENLEGNLASLADGVKSFSFAFVGGWTLGAVTGPLSDLADAVKKWSRVTMPKSIGSNLSELADGVKSFNNIGDISSPVYSVKTIAESVKKIAGVNISGASKSLTELAVSMQKFDSIGDASASIAEFGESLVKGLIRPISEVASQYTNVGADIANAIADGFGKRQDVIVSKVKTVVTKAATVIKGQNNSYRQTGEGLINSIASGVSSSASKLRSSISSVVKSSSSAIRGQYSTFFSAGSYLVTGFANGISSNSWRAAAQSREMASAAAQAAKTELREHSPSKVGFQIGDYFGIGFANGISENIRNAYGVGSKVAQSAKAGLTDTVRRIGEALDRDIDLTPSIRPVLDLSNVRASAGALDKMLGVNYPVTAMGNVSAISTMMSARSQNGVNDDVVSAIDQLRKELGNIGGDSYTINGVSYEEGSDVADAIKTLVRAAKIERRV